MHRDRPHLLSDGTRNRPAAASELGPHACRPGECVDGQPERCLLGQLSGFPVICSRNSSER